MAEFLIIGASSGIGRELAELLAAEGNTVYGTYNRNRIEPGSERLHYYPLNVLEPEYDLSFLPEKIDGIAYCVGSIALKPFARIPAEAFEQDFRLNVAGAVRVLQLALPALKHSSRAAVLFFSTVAVQTGLGFHTQVAASKGAVEGLTRALAAELAPTVRVNCIAPSLTDTPLAAQLLNTPEKREAGAQRHPLKKIGSAKELAQLAAFLLSEKAGWITGQIWHADGGISTLKI